MKKTLSILLAVLLVMSCMAAAFSVSAADSLEVKGFANGIQIGKSSTGRLTFKVDTEHLELYKNGWSITDDYWDANIDDYNYSGLFSLSYSSNGTAGSALVLESSFINKVYTFPMNVSKIRFWINGFTSYASVKFSFATMFGGSPALDGTKDSTGWYVEFTPDDFEKRIVDDIDVTFNCAPTAGALVGSDYQLNINAKAENTASKFSFNTDMIRCATPYAKELCSNNGIYGAGSSELVRNYIAIVKNDNEVVYPKTYEIGYAPQKAPAAFSVDGSDPQANAGNGAVYEAGSSYTYYLLIRSGLSFDLQSETTIYAHGTFYNSYQSLSDAYYFNDNSDTVYYKLGTALCPTAVSRVDITFSADPKEDAAVASDANVKIEVTADDISGKALTIDPGKTLFGHNDRVDLSEYNGEFGISASSYLAVYEGDSIVYPGFYARAIGFAPQRTPAKATVNFADPDGSGSTIRINDADGNEFVIDPAVYELGEFYTYYATFSLGRQGQDYPYAFDDNTEFYVNGVKTTDVTFNANKTAVQVKLADKTAGHELTRVAASPATVDAEGNIEYWHCSICGKNYSDANASQQVTKVTIDKLTPENPTNPENPQGGEDQKPAKSGSCKYCGEDHKGFAGFFIKIIHSILALFGLRK